MQEESKRKGLDKLTMDQIDAEIAAYRREDDEAISTQQGRSSNECCSFQIQNIVVSALSHTARTLCHHSELPFVEDLHSLCLSSDIS